MHRFAKEQVPRFLLGLRLSHRCRSSTTLPAGHICHENGWSHRVRNLIGICLMVGDLWYAVLVVAFLGLSTFGGDFIFERFCSSSGFGIRKYRLLTIEG